MSRTNRPSRPATVWPWLLPLMAASSLAAQTPTVSPALTLKTAFEAAWQLQPEAQALQVRRDAATARRALAEHWTSDTPALTLAHKTDQLGSRAGLREIEIGISAPLWLPDERTRSGALADAEIAALDARKQAAQLHIAAATREAYWAWQRARVEHTLARERLANAQRLATDVSRRVHAGDLAQVDQHQADVAVATAELVQIESTEALSKSALHLSALSGLPLAARTSDTSSDLTPPSEPIPEPIADVVTLNRHPALSETRAQHVLARRAAELAQVQTRAKPELVLTAAQGRESSFYPYQQSVTLGLRLPLGDETRHRAKVADTEANAIETGHRLAQELIRLNAELTAAQQRVESAQTRLTSADQRARLAREWLGFVDKSFRLGESDLPTRLRVEQDSVEASRQASLLRIELAAAISQLRQISGLLPE